METSNKKRSASMKNDHHNSTCKKKKTISTNKDESPIAGTRITDWEEYEKWKEVRGDIEPTMNYVEITPEAIEELRKIKNIIGDYICQLCKIKYENAFALAMHKCPRVVHIEFRCPECDKTFNCPANLASHRRWHKPQPVHGSTLPLSSTPKSALAKHPRCSSRSDSRSTNTSSSTISDTVHEYSTVSTATSSTIDLSKKDSFMINNIQQKTSDEIFRAMFNGNSQRMILPSFSNSYLKQPMMFSHLRSLPITIPSSSSFDFRRLQSSCIFCHEQFSELNHLFQHIRKNHAVTSSTNNNNNNIQLDKIVF